MPDNIPGNSTQLMTVLGPLEVRGSPIVDAHNHVWISRIPGADPGSPVLDNARRILSELKEYRRSGGSMLVDCQPGGCGRDGNRLAQLSSQSQVAIIACTGFHRRRYYSPESTLWKMGSDYLAEHFISELLAGMEETRQCESAARAGFIKIAIEARLEDTPQAALEAAATAASETGAAIEVHTEKGAESEKILAFFAGGGVQPKQVILCHIDKRPDFGLHAELAKSGVLLEYDTFYRPKYDPDHNLWPLIHQMVAAGLDDAVALATDMADSGLWRQFGGAPGLAGLASIIKPRLLAEGIPSESVDRMLGLNITARLCLLNQTCQNQELPCDE